MTAHRLLEIVPACGLVTKIALLQSRTFAARHLPHHSQTTRHEMARRCDVTLSALPRAGRGMNVVRDKPGLGRVAERAILAEVSLVHVLHLMARVAIEQLLLRADPLV